MRIEVSYLLLFNTGIWRDTLALIEEYAEKYGVVHVTVGPVFDYNYDGLADSRSHIQLVRARVTLSSV